MFDNVRLELGFKVRHVQIATLELQDHFANERLFRGRNECPTYGQSILVENGTEVLIPFGNILIVHSRHVAEACDTCCQEIGTSPQVVSIGKTDFARIFDDCVCAADRIAGILKFFECEANPISFGLPVCNWSGLVCLQQVFRIDRVEWQLHLINGDALWGKLESAADVLTPIFPSLADHA